VTGSNLQLHPQHRPQAVRATHKHMCTSTYICVYTHAFTHLHVCMHWWMPCMYLCTHGFRRASHAPSGWPFSAQQFFAQIYGEAQTSRAAPGHVAIAQLSELGKLQRHYTLNIDGLSQVWSMAGLVGMAVQSSRSLGSRCLSWLLSGRLTTAGWYLLVSLVSK